MRRFIVYTRTPEEEDLEMFDVNTLYELPDKMTWDYKGDIDDMIENGSDESEIIEHLGEINGNSVCSHKISEIIEDNFITLL